MLIVIFIFLCCTCLVFVLSTFVFEHIFLSGPSKSNIDIHFHHLGSSDENYLRNLQTRQTHLLVYVVKLYESEVMETIRTVSIFSLLCKER